MTTADGTTHAIVVTLTGVSVGRMLGGTVLVESIFALPGLGRYTFRSAVALDFPGIMGITLVVAVVYLAINLLTDLSYALLDPRVARERAETETIDHDNPLEEVFEDQLACADLIILNKTDLLDAAEEQTVAASLAEQARAAAPILRARQGRVPPACACCGLSLPG